ncbi:hypothetical protein F1559_001394 [Cyanidiococcus yangmingshanensis]|uniref:Uncharacterized protein n=1 Tax=Cyanidiococcus yangmingshanensis TaxID=2690220 RepID=A0A7J7IKY3_9RHOD|nr:hypothetical protein F1559_001394 [Cyanidiococcus yangmingshanensis]
MVQEQPGQRPTTGFISGSQIVKGFLSGHRTRVLDQGRPQRRQRLAVSATLADRELIAQSARGAPLETFRAFFRYQPGRWRSERCYFYRVNDDPAKAGTETTERSETVFQVEPLTSALLEKVLRDNGTSEAQLVDDGFLKLEQAAGFRVSFDTKMERSGDVSASTNLLFVPQAMDAQTARQLGLVRGLYFRDKGYEEDRPIIGQFEFHHMLARLVSTAFSSAASDNGLRQIANYRRPVAWQEDAPLERNRAFLTEVWLLGSGIEERLPN